MILCLPIKLQPFITAFSRNSSVSPSKNQIRYPILPPETPEKAVNSRLKKFFVKTALKSLLFFRVYDIIVWLILRRCSSAG